MLAKSTILFGVFLIILGLIGYTTSFTQSTTALIPALLGMLLMALGGLALKETNRKVAMHVAALVGLIGFLGSASRFLMHPDASTFARQMQAMTAIVCAAFLVLCAHSFVTARRNR